MKCAVCGKGIVRARLCQKHIQEYGLHASDQPEWLRYLIAKNYDDERTANQDESMYYSLDFVEEVMSGMPDRTITGTFRDIYAGQNRPCEEEALENIDKRVVIKKLIKFFGGIVKE